MTLNSAAYAFFLVARPRRPRPPLRALLRRAGVPLRGDPDRPHRPPRPRPASARRSSRARPSAPSAGVVLLGTVGAYALNAWALARTGASTTAFFIYIQPLFAGALAFVVLGEKPSPRLFGAAALIFAGVAFAIWPARSRRPA